MSFALALGTAGYLPKNSYGFINAKAQTTEQQECVYELKDICIYASLLSNSAFV